ncbi:hypothetical protein BCR33DRAFT_711779 [Rhizoclosmatium globosum]|uniref:Zn(2)-C6 fungal-type domain-containing protein n=1 Tax=Rhizoclosmatium globosum TaxID=329046 RepID=A0A1Y2D013_9FUNG|nr:hypothetical protein BCR33DRAFT_711779 [Rhizoclosmatium globosum]|eukprot:ORY52466.1 hypothetical protein BCR33DRAFT_711779 [Rhizoclosmatium globosum]
MTSLSPFPHDMDIVASLLRLTKSIPDEEDPVSSKVPRPLPCFCCRQQRKKCDLVRPTCARCLHRGTPCEYPTTRKPYMTKARKRLAQEAARKSGRKLNSNTVTLNSNAAAPLSPTSQYSSYDKIEMGRQSSEESMLAPTLLDDKVESPAISTMTLRRCFSPMEELTSSLMQHSSKNMMSVSALID